MLTRTLRCAIQPDVIENFESDLAKHGFHYEVETKFLNGTAYKVEVPVKLADTFATYVNSNWGKML